MTRPMAQAGGGEHAAALAALLYLPLVVVALLAVIEIGAWAGLSPALWTRRAYLSTRPAVRLAAMGMTVSAVVHLALVPPHLAADPVLGVLFALDGVALLAVAGWSLTRPFRGWRPAGIAVLAGGLLAYVWYVASGMETADAVGIATKVVELATIGLLLMPPGPVVVLPRRSRRPSPLAVRASGEATGPRR